MLINKPPAPEGFFEDLGTFHAVWQGLDVIIDFAIGHFKGLDAQQTLVETAGGTFGSKLGELKKLVARSDHADKAALETLIKELFSSRRNEITHSYLDTELDEVKFVYRGDKAGAKPCTLGFKGRSFSHHVGEFTNCANRFQAVLQLDPVALDAFAAKAEKLAASIEPGVR